MDHVEQIIKRAQERGDFDNLPGAGKPQDLRVNPWVPPDWRMAYDMLAGAGFAPDVVEEDKLLRARMADLETRLERFARRWRNWSAGERRVKLDQREGFLREYAEEIRAINNRIHGFNALAPAAMQRGTLHLASMVRAAEARLPIEGE